MLRLRELSRPGSGMLREVSAPRISKTSTAKSREADLLRILSEVASIWKQLNCQKRRSLFCPALFAKP